MDLSYLVERWAISLAFDAGRYLVFAGVAHLVFWRWGRARWKAHRVLGRDPQRHDVRHDALASAMTVVVFSVMGVLVHALGTGGVLRRYEDPLAHGALWLVLAVPVLLVLQDAWFYWTHRAMHHPRLFARFHRVHHAHKTPSPWSAYAFALPEALVHAIFVPLIWLVLPLHELSVFVFLLVMIFRNVQGHLGLELGRSGDTRHPFFGLFTTTTHHALHHEHAGFDFGLYFTFWDRVMGTEHPRYHATFERVAAATPSRETAATT